MNDSTQNRTRWIELSWVYALTLLVTGVASAIQGAVAWLDGYLLVIAAATFLYLPLEVIAHRGGNPVDYGIHRQRLIRAALVTTLFCAVIFPPYSFGFHIWQTEVVGQSFKPDEARFDRWPMEVRGIPARKVPEPGQIHLFHQNSRFWLTWHLQEGEQLEVAAQSEGPFERVQGGWRRKADSLYLRTKSKLGRATLETSSQDISFDIKTNQEHLKNENIRVGAAFMAAETNPVPIERGYFWLFELILVQLLLVALPEEVFFRGYLQTSIDKLWGRDRRVFGVDFNLSSAVLVSVLFAIGHFVTIPNPARLAVFFPSLVFGWLRRATGGIAAPVFFHAACNLYVEMALVYYQPE